MITISAACCFAAYNRETKLLESSIITIGENTTIACNADERLGKVDTMFCQCRTKLVSDLNALGIKNYDGSVITEEEV